MQHNLIIVHDDGKVKAFKVFGKVGESVCGV